MTNVNDLLPEHLGWLRIAPESTEPEPIRLPPGCAVYGYESDFDGFITLLIMHPALPQIQVGGVIPLVKLGWPEPGKPVWEITNTVNDEDFY